MNNTNKHRAGFVSIVGKPNVGKSTLLNSLLKSKLSIVSPKAQTTRRKILGILNGEDYQMVFLDTPGYMNPKYELHNVMIKYILDSIQDADVIIFLVVPKEKFPEDEIIEALKKVKKPIILAVNKIDVSKQPEVISKIQTIKQQLPNIKEEIAISAMTGHNLDKLVELIKKYLPESPPFYPKDQISDLPERLFAAEIIREKLFLFLKEEIPYSCLVDIIFFKEEEDKINIEAYIYVEKKSQKSIVIGKNGSMIKKIKKAALDDLRNFFGKEVFLKLTVKVMDNWTKDSSKLKRFGYK